MQYKYSEINVDAKLENVAAEVIPTIHAINPLECFFRIKGHVAPDRNPGSGYDTPLLRLIQGEVKSERPHRHFHTQPGLLGSRATLSNSYPNACVPSSGQFVPFLRWYDPVRTLTHNLPHER